MEISIKQDINEASRKRLDAFTAVLIVLPKLTRWPEFAYAEIVRERMQRSGAPLDAGLFVCDLPNAKGTQLAVSFVAENDSMFERLSAARRQVAAICGRRPREVAVLAAGFKRKTIDAIIEPVVAALLAAAGELPTYKSKPKKSTPLAGIVLLGVPQALNLQRTQAEALGNHLARRLTSLPPNELTPGIYRKQLAHLAREHGWRMDVYDQKKLRAKKAGAFLAVARGSATPDACIVRLRYRPSSRAPRLALVGKGICFDTGGMNLKPAKSMHGMHEDMQGSAVALGALLALTRLKANYHVDCWLALAQNHIGPKAYKQNDVVVACNGTSIEIVHTDAEGRMVLADTLALAARGKPDMIVDYATLTGACIYALGTAYSGVFCNRPALNNMLIAAGDSSGERVWPFPMSEDFDKELESKIADIKQCTLAGEADHILGARFLRRFVDDVPWVHVDLAAGNNKGGLAHIPSDVTGFGVRFTLNLVLEQQVLKHLAT